MQLAVWVFLPNRQPPDRQPPSGRTGALASL